MTRPQPRIGSPASGRLPGGRTSRPRLRYPSLPPRPPRRDLRHLIAWLSGLNVIAGIWLIIAPWVLGYGARDPRWNDVVFGAVVGVIALTRAAGAYREEWLSWLNAIIGVWVFIAAFTIDNTATASWNDLIVGTVVFLLAVSSAELTADLVLRGRGRDRAGV